MLRPCSMRAGDRAGARDRLSLVRGCRGRYGAAVITTTHRSAVVRSDRSVIAFLAFVGHPDGVRDRRRAPGVRRAPRRFRPRRPWRQPGHHRDPLLRGDGGRSAVLWGARRSLRSAQRARRQASCSTGSAPWRARSLPAWSCCSSPASSGGSAHPHRRCCASRSPATSTRATGWLGWSRPSRRSS